MSKMLPLTVIDARNLRGILAPPSVISRELLDDLVDFITLSAPDVVSTLEGRSAEADRKKAWVSASVVERRVKRRRHASK